MGRRADVIDLAAWRARREERGPTVSAGEALSRELVAERFADGWECLADDLEGAWP
ncbi:hypothetical protein QE364_002848 [Nocardioides zeae]|uniref:Uncharacterized protein n=1 Tax=Nocardioides zeae TaxID=1457234 RepID=A0ACC6IKA1_9ACTN|nr:hypothetical protein [Nocardioides zeae]MDR6173726.1 hypothetical protein [Nocardioides zeae]MDR6211129.1 hypothetical protein [Nocardioides zeae]